MSDFFRVWNVMTQSYDDNLHCCFIDCDGELMVRSEFDNNGRFVLYSYSEGAIEYNTGLLDKNGKCIYENDVLSDGINFGCVYWDDSGWACTSFLNKKLSELEIVGTTHDKRFYTKDIR